MPAITIVQKGHIPQRKQVYMQRCPDCQNTRRSLRVSANGFKWIARCRRCEARR